MNREEKIKKAHKIICEMTDVYDAAKQIIDAIDPPKIEVGMWGYSPDAEIYGRLNEIGGHEVSKYKLGERYCIDFIPIPGLKEAIEKLEKECQ